MENEKIQYAVLIDADNISSKYAAAIFDELSPYGYASFRRIYGNWAKSNGWKEDVLLEYSITPIQQFSYTVGKNSTDMAMVIDAMDILYSNKVKGFCLATSDSDFTRLAMRLREANMHVIGMGESKTPKALTRACNKFIHLNLIEQEKDAETAAGAALQQAQLRELDNVTPMDEVKTSIVSLLNESVSGSLSLSGVGQALGEKYSDFDVRNYGYTKLSVFISEEMPGVLLYQDAHGYSVKRIDQLRRADLEADVMDYLRKNGGTVENLSTVWGELKTRHPEFDLKDFGYSRMSSFLRSMSGVSVSGNRASMKKSAEPKPAKRKSSLL